MSRRIFLAVATAAMVAAGLVGCGIPEQTGVHVDGGGAAPGPGSNDGSGKQPPKRKASGENVPQFALNFLKAAAGEASSAYQRVREYIAPEGQRALPEKPGQEVDISVVRLTGRSPTITPNNDDGTWSVKISVQQVGLLRANGALEAPVERESEYTFVVGPRADVRQSDGSEGLYVKEPPRVLLMSTDALQEFYQQRTIYFWSKDGPPTLVPDLRYLPVALPTAGQATEVVRWLVAGPAGWLQATVAGLPAGTKTLGNVFPQSDGRLVVNLSVDSPLADTNAELDRLGTQLVWSLRENLGNKLELTIKDQGNRVFDVGEQREANPAYRIDRPPQRFCVYAGAVRQLLNPGEAPGEPPPIAAGNNRNIESAALTKDSGPVSAALVTASGSRQRLLVGSGAGTVGKFARSSRTYGFMGRPVWLKNPGSPDLVGLVVADDQLYRFDLHAALTAVDLPGAGKVTNLAAALDGRRIAYVSGGDLFVAPLAIDGTSIEAGPARRVPTSLHGLTAVEWTGENALVAAGTDANGRVSLRGTTVDGAVESSSVDDLGTATVTDIAAYPYNPVRGGGGRPMYVANGVAWDGSPDRPIDAGQVEGVGASAPPAGGAKPTAPFFLY